MLGSELVQSPVDRLVVSIGGKKLPARLLAMGERTVCLAAADDWLNDHETEDAASKSRKWLNQAATAQQLRYLPPAYRQDFGLTHGQQSCGEFFPSAHAKPMPG
jgi:hypothetical protein